jgi:gas vesicle protein
MEDNNGRGSTVVAFAIGVLAGGVTALLFAPQTGAQMRRRLTRSAQDLYEKGEELARSVGEKTETVVADLKVAASEARNTYRDEREKRPSASGTETKHAGAEMAGSKGTGSQS